MRPPTRGMSIPQSLADFDVVAGAPGVVFYAGEHAVLDGGVAVVQQIPLRVWVGLRAIGDNPGKDKTNLLGSTSSVRSLHLVDRQIEPRFISDNTLKLSADLINQLVQIKPLSDRFGSLGSYEIGVVTQFRPNCGGNFSGAYSVALVTALAMLSDRNASKSNLAPLLSLIDAATADGQPRPLWGGTPDWDQMRSADSWLNRLNRFAWVIETFFHGGSSSGCGTLCSLLPSSQPLVYVRQHRQVPYRSSKKSSERKPEIAMRRDQLPLTRDALKAIQRWLLGPWEPLHTGQAAARTSSKQSGRSQKERPLSYRGLPLSELLGWKGSFTPRYNYGLVYSGQPKTGPSTSGSIDLVWDWAKHINEAGARARRRMHARGREYLHGHVDRTADLLARLADTTEGCLRQLYEGVTTASFGVISALHGMHETEAAGPGPVPQQDRAFDQFRRAIWAAHGSLYMCGLIDDKARDVIALLVNAACRKDHNPAIPEPLGVKFTGGGGGGYLLVVAKHESNYFDRLRDHLSTARQSEASLDFVSADHLDALPGVLVWERACRPVAVEQFVFRHGQWKLNQPVTPSVNPQPSCVPTPAITLELDLSQLNRLRVTLTAGSSVQVAEQGSCPRGLPALVNAIIWVVRQDSARGTFDAWSTLGSSKYQGDGYASAPDLPWGGRISPEHRRHSVPPSELVHSIRPIDGRSTRLPFFTAPPFFTECGGLPNRQKARLSDPASFKRLKRLNRVEPSPACIKIGNE